MNLVSVAERVAAIERSGVAFEPRRCLRAGDKFSTCEICQQVCPVAAIQPGTPPAFKADACIRCWACLPACPVGAFGADDAVPALLNCAARLEADALELLCEQHPHGQAGLSPANVGVRVRGCLAGLGVSAYLALVALGLEHIWVRTDACAQCAWGSLRSQVEAHVDQARRLLEPWGRAQALEFVASESSPALNPRPIWEADNPPLSRRDLFRMASRRGQVMMARAMTQGPDNGAQRPAVERQRVINAIARLPIQPQTNESASLPAGTGFGSVSVSEACTACGVCSRACPTGALQFHQDGEVHYQLVFSAATCIGCETCRHVCVSGAVAVNPRPTVGAVFNQKAPVVLRAGGLMRCDRCHVLTAARPGARLCPTCEFRRQHPLGPRPVPGLTTVRP
jgi:Fe-S-cluster-containing hydrogenase component 2